MKKTIILIFSLFLIFSLVIVSIKTVDADSGWDSSYDSGGSSDWGDSDWGDSDWGDSDFGSSSGDSFFEILLLIIFVIYLIVKFSSSIEKNKQKIHTDAIKENIENNKYIDVSGDELAKLGMPIGEFKNLVFEIYKNIQDAWMEFDYKKLRKYTTDEIYNSYVMQLDALKLKKQKNIMKDFKCVKVRIYNVKEENGILNVSAYLNVLMYDYVVDKDGKTVRGNDKRRINIEYELTFVKTSKKKTKTTICSNCGAKINMNASGKCEYCGSVVKEVAKDYVMSKKTCVGQRME